MVAHRRRGRRGRRHRHHYQRCRRRRRHPSSVFVVNVWRKAKTELKFFNDVKIQIEMKKIEARYSPLYILSFRDCTTCA